MSNLLYRAVVAVALLVGLFTAATTLLAWLRFHPHVPIFDTLLLLPLVDRALTGGVASVPAGEWLGLFGNTHRILVTRVLAVTDFSVFGGRNHLPLAVSWLSVGFTLWLYATVMRRATDNATALLALGVCLVFFLTPTNLYNLVTPINTSWFVALAAGAGAIALVVQSGESFSPVRALGILALGLLAAFSNFAGVVVCLVLCVLLVVCRVPYRWPLLVVLLVFVGLYLQGVQSTGQMLQESDRFRDILANMSQEQIQQLQQSAAASPLDRVGGLLAAVVQELFAAKATRYPLLAYLVSAVLALYLGWQGVQFLRARIAGDQRDSTAKDFYLAMALLSLGILLAIALGRSREAQTVVERYQMISTTFWASLACLVIVSLPAKGQAVLRLIVSAAVVLGAIGLTWRADLRYLPKVATMGEAASRAQVLMSLGVTDFSTHRHIRPLGTMDGLYARNFSMLSREGLADLAYPTVMPDQNERACHGVSASLQPSQWPGVSALQLRFQQLPAYRIREAYVFLGDSGAGMLYPTYPGRVSWRSALRGSQTWRGYAGDALDESAELRIVFVPWFGKEFSCSLG